MADVISGRMATKQGSLHPVPEGMMCDGYNIECTEVATVRVQAETDSFGCEMWDLCAACYSKCLDTKEE